MRHSPLFFARGVASQDRLGTGVDAGIIYIIFDRTPSTARPSRHISILT